MNTSRFAFRSSFSTAWSSITAAAALIFFVMITGSQAHAQAPEVVTFDVPQAGTSRGEGTIALGINQTGAVIGDYRDSARVFHGFVRSRNGVITTFDVPGAGTARGQGTLPHSINPAGEIAGYSVGPDYHAHGFVRSPDGNLTTFDVAGASDTFVVNLNARGEIAGFFNDAAGVAHGFMRSADGTVTTFDAPGAGPTGTFTCSVTCLNAAGDVAGFYFDANNIGHSFVRARNGALAIFDSPGAGAITGSYQGTFSASINDGGVLAGAYVDANNVYHGFLRAKNGAMTSFDVPGTGMVGNPLCPGPGTVPSGLNASDAVVGCYTDVTGGNHSFLRARDGSLTTFDIAGAGPSPVEGTLANGNDSSGSVTGTYIDANRVRHGFLWTLPSGQTK